MGRPPPIAPDVRWIQPRPHPAALEASRLLRQDARLPDRDRLLRPVRVVRRRATDRIDDLHPRHDTTERGMLRVQPRVVDDVDEELASHGVRARVRHGDRSSRVPVVRGELVLDRVAGAAVSGALRVATLDHEAGDDAMEDRAVVEVLLDELPKVPGRDGHAVVEELDLHVAHRRLQEDDRHAPAIRAPYVKPAHRMPASDGPNRYPAGTVAATGGR